MLLLVGGDVIENRQTVLLPGLKQPMPPSLAVSLKTKQKLPVVTAVRQVPDRSRQEEAIGARHAGTPTEKTPHFRSKMACLRTENGSKECTKSEFSITCIGPTPG